MKKIQYWTMETLGQLRKGQEVKKKEKNSTKQWAGVVCHNLSFAFFCPQCQFMHNNIFSLQGPDPSHLVTDSKW